MIDVSLDDVPIFLRRTPAVLRALVAELPERWLDALEAPGTFSVRDVLGHLIDGEETDWIPRLEIMLRDGESRPFTPFDRTAFRERYAGWAIGRLLDTFAARRAASLERLAAFGLGPADLARTGTHPEFGRVTISQLLATWVAHDLTHLSQIARVTAKQYGEAVGPWKAYLGVLQR